MSQPTTVEEDARAERAFRAAIAGVQTPGAVDPAGARRRAGRRRAAGLTATAVLVAAVLTIALVGLPRLMTRDSPTAAPVVGASGAAPAGWRTEYYRDIAFEVPASWGYDEEPDWCTDFSRKSSEYPRNYVQLGRHRLDDLVLCDRDARALLTEHVAVRPVHGDERDSTKHTRGYWTLTQVIGSAVFTVVSKSRARAEAILHSVVIRRDGPDAACPARSPVELTKRVRPERPFDVTAIRSVSSITLCQYDPDLEGGWTEGGLTARKVLTGASAADLLSRIRTARPVPVKVCADGHDVNLALTIRLESAGVVHEMVAQTFNCYANHQTFVGGFDDGTTMRAITAADCKAVLVPPLTLNGFYGTYDSGNCGQT